MDWSSEATNLIHKWIKEIAAAASKPPATMITALLRTTVRLCKVENLELRHFKVLSIIAWRAETKDDDTRRDRGSKETTEKNETPEKTGQKR